MVHSLVSSIRTRKLKWGVVLLFILALTAIGFKPVKSSASETNQRSLASESFNPQFNSIANFHTYLPIIVVASTGFNSQFNGNATGWITHSGGNWSVNSTYYYSNGLANSWSITSYNANFSNFDFQTKVMRYVPSYSSGSSGVVVRGTPEPHDPDNDWRNGYYFLYSREGDFSVWKTVSRTDIAIQNWTPSPVINTGDTWNTLRVVANGNSMYYYINGTLVWSGSDSSFSSGRVGLGFYDDGAETTFYADWATLEIGSSTVGVTDVVDSNQQALNDAVNADPNNSVTPKYH
jgi:hypothetical protein